MENKEKVYCSECKFYKSTGWRGVNECKKTYEVRWPAEDTYAIRAFSNVEKNKYVAASQNKNNDCEFFEKKIPRKR
jgi:hypothetical protein